MNKITNFQIGEQLWVVTEPLQRTTAPPATSVDHVFVISPCASRRICETLSHAPARSLSL